MNAPSTGSKSAQVYSAANVRRRLAGVTRAEMA